MGAHGKTINIIVPRDLAHDWDTNDIPDLKSKLNKIGAKYAPFIGVLNVDSSEKFLECVEAHKIVVKNGEIPDPKYAKNYNGTRHFISD